MNQSARKRIAKVEGVLTAKTTPQTVEEIQEAFLRGDYGPPADLFRILLSGRKPEGYPPELLNSIRGGR
jgi:hypothetical protein